MEANGPWRETLKRLLETPPAMGVEIVQAPIEHIIRETDVYVKSQIAVVCDPDALEQTARKNAELMATLRETNDKLERGELVEVVRCKDCKWYSVGSMMCYRPYCNGWMGINDFCSRGERRER